MIGKTGDVRQEQAQAGRQDTDIDTREEGRGVGDTVEPPTVAPR